MAGDLGRRMRELNLKHELREGKDQAQRNYRKETIKQLSRINNINYEGIFFYIFTLGKKLLNYFLYTLS